MGSTEKAVEVPDELRVLLPEKNKMVVVIGSRAYEVFPMTEGVVERVSKDVADILGKVFNNNVRCPKCEKMFRDQLGITTECPDCKVAVVDCRESPIEAIISSAKIPKLVEQIIEVPANVVAKNMTIPQMKHFAGVFWKQNLSDDGLPEESRKNFQGLLMAFIPGRKKEEMKEPDPMSAAIVSQKKGKK